MTPKSKNWQEEEALKRFQIIAPLLDETLDLQKKLQLRAQIAQNEGISERSIYRYEKLYREGNFEGLKPQPSGGHGPNNLPENFGELLAEAILLKREVPSRSVNQIILILEIEGKVAPGTLHRSTLQRHLYNAGYGKKQMKKYASAQNSSARRFCKPHRMMLAQADIKYGLHLPIGPHGESVQTYIVSIIDDHSRLILGTGVYPNQEAEIVEDAYRKAILQYGAFDATYVDNGTQFISKQLLDALSRLGIRRLRAKPYAAESKGKVEVYNRLINSYLAECKAKKVRTLEDANKYWNLFVEEYYHNKPHEGIAEYYSSINESFPAEGITPLQEFNRDSRPLKYLDATVVGKAFLHHESRRVDKGSCISFGGKKYEVPQALIGATVEIEFDPMVTEVITVYYPGIDSFTAHPLSIGEFCGTKPKLPEHMLPVEPETSRFLDALEKRHRETLGRNADAISFSSFRKGDDANV